MTKFKYVKPVKDRHGVVRYYFRLADDKLVPMRGAFRTEEFAAHHAELLVKRAGETLPPEIIPFPRKQRYLGHEMDAMLTAPVPARSSQVIFAPGTLGWATNRWLSSHHFKNRPEGTRKNYGHLASLLLAHKFALVLLADVRSKHVIRFAGELEEQRGPSRGKAMLAVISNIWEYGVDLPEVKFEKGIEPINPAKIAYRKIKYRVRKPHKRWPEAVCSKFLDGAPDHLQRMYSLLLYTGQRRSDVQKMKWEDYDAKAGILSVWQKKTGEWVPVPVHRQLAKILAATPRIEDHILTSSHRQSRYAGESSLSHAIRNRLLAVGIPDGIYTLHGLRVTAAHILAENGATEHQLMKIFGWRKPEQAAYYVRETSKLVVARAGMAKWEAADEQTEKKLVAK